MTLIGSTARAHEALDCAVVWTLMLALLAAASTNTGDEAEVQAFRREREQRLRAPDGWLALVGLAWLHPGANRFGSAPDDEVRMPAAVPPHAGTLFVDGKTVRAAIAPGVAATLNGRRWDATGPVALRSDAGDATPDIVGVGAVTLQVIDRGGRLGARLKDPDSEARRSFGGLSYYPFDPAYRVTARLRRAPAPTKMVIPDASGGRQEMQSPGTLAFTLLGRRLALDPVNDGPDDDNLLVVFRDPTSGRETYAGGRFLRARRAKGASDDAWVVDFNQAYNPPCAFTPYATCPLPPPQNRLPLPIPAGEKAPAGAAH